jgi:hypothetical protein
MRFGPNSVIDRRGSGGELKSSRRNYRRQGAGGSAGTSGALPAPQPADDLKAHPLAEALDLLRRQLELEEAMHSRGGIRVIDERELWRLRESLKRFPAAVGAILEASNRLHRRVATLSVHDVTENPL